DRDLWESSRHNPVRMLGGVRQERLDEVAADDAYLASLAQVYEKFEKYMRSEGKFQREYPERKGDTVAYFSAEFGLHECLPLYSGGLGVLAGDYLKTASDLGFPMVGVGLLYQNGYCRQRLNSDGWQQDAYEDNDFYNMPIKLVPGHDDHPVTVDLDLPQGCVRVQVWRARVGRVELYLLDTNLQTNQPDDRRITGQLYDSDPERRIQQEIVLGIGGVRVLEKLGVRPAIYHMNEGHSAFLVVERLRQLMRAENISFDEAREAVTAGNIFTTHTSLSAGNDRFSSELIGKYFSETCNELGLTHDEFMRLGQEEPGNPTESFCMTVFAMRFSGYSNGVSKLHGEISRSLWRGVWPGIPENEVPITSISNGIHPQTWVSGEMSALFEQYLKGDWQDQVTKKSVWARVRDIPDEELWRVHEGLRERLIGFVRGRLKEQLSRRGAPVSEIERSESVLDPKVLTIGFARRFAAYKRAGLVIRDMERLKKILCDRDRPVQIIFAGKAHPRDSAGKDVIRQIIHLVRDDRFRRRIVFLEGYDINVARYMVQGVDVWLNTPRRPLEASGTSGMKVAANGGLNVSILDGWWAEGYEPEVGWAIGSGESYEDPGYQDMVESQAIYNMLENEAVPLFYTRSADNLPRAWIRRVKNS
ncbi:MAG: alpha-glucan family phosphorylase, partial [Dehalococcoidia bacterium]|nr:alpha-glucan family phosphorylase [Dehalococcoidia bacterium]